MQDPIGSYKINLEFLQDPTTFDLGSYQDPVGMLYENPFRIQLEFIQDPANIDIL